MGAAAHARCESEFSLDVMAAAVEGGRFSHLMPVRRNRPGHGALTPGSACHRLSASDQLSSSHLPDVTRSGHGGATGNTEQDRKKGIVTTASRVIRPEVTQRTRTSNKMHR